MTFATLALTMYGYCEVLRNEEIGYCAYLKPLTCRRCDK